MPNSNANFVKSLVIQLWRTIIRFASNFQSTTSPNIVAMIASSIPTIFYDWYPNSGANNHITSNFGNLSYHSKYQGSHHVKVGNDQMVSFSHFDLSTFFLAKKNIFLDIYTIKEITISSMSIEFTFISLTGTFHHKQIFNNILPCTLSLSWSFKK